MSSFDIVQWNKERYARDQAALQAALDAMGGSLGERIAVLHHQQSSIGFIKDALDQVVRCRFEDPEHQDRSILVQYNPVRELRRLGAGRKIAPAGYDSVNGGCFLCPENIEWQQSGLEMGYRFQIGERSYIAWCNPFPFMPYHVTISSVVHEPQSWLVGDPEKSGERLARILRDLMNIVGQTPDFIGFYNGLGAGASIPQHLHYHFFKRTPGSEPFALEKTAQWSINQGIAAPFHAKPYPITSIYFQGDADTIIEQAVAFYDEWENSCGSTENISANIIATPFKDGTYALYFTPRNRQFSISAGRAEPVAGLEVLGEIALSRQEEYLRLTSGQMQFDELTKMLKSVEAPEAASLVRALQSTFRFGRRSTDRR